MCTILSHGQFFGSLTHTRQIGGLLLTETRYAPRTRVPNHAHENAYLCFVRQGHYTEVFDGRTRSCGPSTLAFHPAGERHAERFEDAECRSFNIELTQSWHSQFPDYAHLLRDSSALRSGPLVFLALRLAQEFRMTDSASGLAIEGLCLELLAGFVRRVTPEQLPRWLARARDLLHNTFRDNLDLVALAREVGVHPVHLATTFRQHFHCTMGDYQRRLRVEFACRQLAAGEVSLAEIATAAGFSDQSHFTRLFKRYLGVTPGAYRRRLAHV